jgi:hypothetical protein
VPKETAFTWANFLDTRGKLFGFPSTFKSEDIRQLDTIRESQSSRVKTATVIFRETYGDRVCKVAVFEVSSEKVVLVGGFIHWLN